MPLKTSSIKDGLCRARPKIDQLINLPINQPTGQNETTKEPTNRQPTTTKTFIHPVMFYIKHGDDIYIDKYYSLVFT